MYLLIEYKSFSKFFYRAKVNQIFNVFKRQGGDLTLNGYYAFDYLYFSLD